MHITDVITPTHEKVIRIDGLDGGLTGFIALHSTTRGPAAGGLRMRPYAGPANALNDVLRLSRGMTFKNAAADLPLGGGKAVIVGDPASQKTPALLEQFGSVIDSLNGQYWTAEDMGMSPVDMAVLARKTRYVAGLADGEFASGDPSPITAKGIFNAVRTTAKHRFGSADLKGKTVSVQGLGNVGMHLCGLLRRAGAQLIVTDLNPDAVAEAEDQFAARAVPLDDIYGVKADIFAPCAIGAILNDKTIPQLQVAAVAGGANNQLATEADADALHARGILYAPDYVANGGGIINVATEILQIKDGPAWRDSKLEALKATMEAILTRAVATNRSPHRVADEIVAPKISPRAA
ncbi:MAG: Glu/Leu/Phe/Val dehydrogenase [Rhodobacteraceae bacterium]|nr:Glu/Leu/Phe/Val dehydrogenase [Paracoccaceae bacterium]